MNKINVRSDLIWAYLIHLGYNAWYESDAPYRGKYSHASDKIRCDKETWDELLENMAQVGVNTVVIDLNEAVRYESHPEIAAEGAWSTDLLRDEINKMRKMGLNPIPKLNFSTCHDIW
ncbi:MAG: Tat pathway signal protein, partial [Caldicoprobacterales bacterium]